MLAEYGLDANAVTMADARGGTAESVADALEDLAGALSELIDEWEDADREERVDLKDEVSTQAGSVLGELAPPAASPPAVAPMPPVATDLPTAAWYPNPNGAGQRYWDGHRWTDHYAQ